MNLAYITLAVLWLAVIAYAVLGGADFGGGVWDLFASGPHAKQQRHLVDEAIGPVWEANHVWLIFLIVGLFTAFPLAFSVLSITLFVPFTLALVGIVLRGAAFVFHLHAPGASRTRAIWGRVFSAASAITPFLLGASAAAIASGQIHASGGHAQTVDWTLWMTPFALTVGAMAVSLCAVLAAIYLTVEAQQARELELLAAFRVRAIIAGAVTAVLGALGLVLAPFQAPLLWNGVLGKALPAVIVTMLVGLGAAASLFLGRYRLARVLIVLETACLLGSWAVAQLPYLIPPDVTISNAASPDVTLIALLVSTAIGAVFLAPSLWLLFRTFKSSKPAPARK
ncbi:MAG TPA: cytochrome d ubiquinol oxidase subunit II [Ktedonobacterales bacterium]|nr:cytochrome d ubiquinol oxidase subunit II [Ktedonobacterales bacterium]